MNVICLSRIVLRFVFLLSLCSAACGDALARDTGDAGKAKAGLISTAKASAQKAQECQHFLHDDADEFEGCIDGQLRSITKSKSADAQRLGVLYFAFAGALNSARVSLPGAEEATSNYAHSTLKLKKKLKFSDADLCAVLSGDCASRQAALMSYQRS